MKKEVTDPTLNWFRAVTPVYPMLGMRKKQFVSGERIYAGIYVDNKIILGGENGLLWFYNSANNHQVYRVKTGNNDIKCLRASANGKYVLSVDQNGIICIWDVGDPSNVLLLRKQDLELFRNAELSTNGDWAAIVMSESFELWEIQSEKYMGCIRCSKENVTAANFTADSKYCIICEASKIVLIDLNTLSEIELVKEYINIIKVIISSDSQKIIFVVSENLHDTIMVYDFKTMHKLASFDLFEPNDFFGFQDRIIDLVLAENDTKIIIATQHAKILIFDSEPLSLLNVWIADVWKIYCIEYIKDVKELLVIGDEGVSLWNYKKQKSQLLQTNLNKGNCVYLFTSDEKSLLVGNQHGEVNLLYLDSGDSRKIFQCHQAITAMCYDSCHDKVLCGTGNGKLYILGPYYNKAPKYIRVFGSAISNVVFCERTKYILCCSYHGEVCYWQINCWSQRMIWVNEQAYICSAAVGIEHKMIAIGLDDGSMVILSQVNMKEIERIKVSDDNDMVVGIAFDNKRNRLITKTQSGVFRIWSTKSFKCIQTIKNYDIGSRVYNEIYSGYQRYCPYFR